MIPILKKINIRGYFTTYEQSVKEHYEIFKQRYIELSENGKYDHDYFDEIEILIDEIAYHKFLSDEETATIKIFLDMIFMGLKTQGDIESAEKLIMEIVFPE